MWKPAYPDTGSNVFVSFLHIQLLCLGIRLGFVKVFLGSLRSSLAPWARSWLRLLGWDSIWPPIYSLLSPTLGSPELSCLILGFNLALEGHIVDMVSG